MIKKDVKQVVIVGAGGHAKVVADIVLQNGDVIIGFLDGINPEGEFLGYPKLGRDVDYKKYLDYYFVIAIGYTDVRKRIASFMTDAKFYTAIHPSASISKIGVSIGEGTVVMANATINSCTSIGKHCILNSCCVVDHDNKIEDYVHISVGAKAAGKVHIGEETWVGVGASIINDISICSDCILGAGVVVVKDIDESGTYVGVPAKRIK